MEAVADLSIVAAPGATFGLESGYRADAEAITRALISHAERMRYRLAVLDCGNAQSIAQVRAMRAAWNSACAALYSPWVRATGALLGTNPEEAYVVKCNRSTMTQADLDAGRLVCLIGVALLQSAEFLIFRIGQWTADRRG